MRLPSDIHPLVLVASTLACVLAGGLLLSGCSAQVSITAIVLGYLLATGAMVGLTGCGDEEQEEQIITNPVPDAIDEDGDGFYLQEDDCDDTNAAVNPAAVEICDDGIDNNCDNQIDMDDDACPEVSVNPAPEDDADGDGYDESVDCDDQNPDINPDAEEDCYDGLDNDCDDLVDEADDECPEIIVNPGPEDADGDGYSAAEDCNDNDASIHPGASENCEDGVDNNCNDLIDEADDACPEIIVNPAPDDADNDGYMEPVDCNDNDATINPGATEDCYDGIDNDCDNLVDLSDSECADIVINPAPDDADNDGYSEPVDCNDLNPSIHPGASENCFDGIDNDCDNLVDDMDEECPDIVINPAPEDF